MTAIHVLRTPDGVPWVPQSWQWAKKPQDYPQSDAYTDTAHCTEYLLPVHPYGVLQVPTRLYGIHPETYRIIDHNDTVPVYLR